MAGERRKLTRELVEARAAIQRQLDIIKGPASSGDRWGDRRSVVAKLEDGLRQINAALAARGIGEDA